MKSSLFYQGYRDRCPRCGYEPQEDKFCPVCGKGLGVLRGPVESCAAASILIVILSVIVVLTALLPVSMNEDPPFLFVDAVGWAAIATASALSLAWTISIVLCGFDLREERYRELARKIMEKGENETHESLRDTEKVDHASTFKIQVMDFKATAEEIRKSIGGMRELIKDKFLGGSKKVYRKISPAPRACGNCVFCESKRDSFGVVCSYDGSDIENAHMTTCSNFEERTE